jgi:hypothetical protein
MNGGSAQWTAGSTIGSAAVQAWGAQQANKHASHERRMAQHFQRKMLVEGPELHQKGLRRAGINPILAGASGPITGSSSAGQTFNEGEGAGKAIGEITDKILTMASAKNTKADTQFKHQQTKTNKAQEKLYRSQENQVKEATRGLKRDQDFMDNNPNFYKVKQGIGVLSPVIAPLIGGMTAGGGAQLLKHFMNKNDTSTPNTGGRYKGYRRP